MLVIDSGSRDRSREIARAAGATVIEIPPEEFGHGRTRNLARGPDERRARGLPDPGRHARARRLAASSTWTASGWPSAWARRSAPTCRARTRARSSSGCCSTSSTTSPRAASRWSTAAATPPTSSNSNSCVARAAWEQIPFREIPYAEDQALGADLLAAGWTKVFNPSAGVVHSHDYGLVEAFRRYFDEYRGLRDSVGQRTQASPVGVADMLRRSVAADRAYLQRDRALARVKRARWTAQSAVHHTRPARVRRPRRARRPGLGAGARAALARPARRRGDAPRGAVGAAGPRGRAARVRRRGRAALAAVALRRRPRVARARLGRAPVRDRERRAGRRSSGSCASSSRAATAARCGCTTRRGSSPTRARRCAAG